MLPTFPQFKSLSLDDKAEYERLVAEYPPFSDITFATLHIWWNLEGNLSLSQLNGNLIINYHLPFDEQNSGYSLIGKKDLDESVKTIFKYLKSIGQPVKLVHVPEFVVDQITKRGQIQIIEELDYNEYILDSQNTAKLEGTPHRITRRKIRRFGEGTIDKKVEIRKLDLSLREVQDELLEAVHDWDKTQPTSNDPENTEHLAIKNTLRHATKLDIRHLGLYIDDKLHAIVLYHQTNDKQYYIIHHLKVDYSVPYIFDYVTHHIADEAVREDIAFINMEMDLGIAGLREHKMGLRPVDFFRKYTITPK